MNNGWLAVCVLLVLGLPPLCLGRGIEGGNKYPSPSWLGYAALHLNQPHNKHPISFVNFTVHTPDAPKDL